MVSEKVKCHLQSYWGKIKAIYFRQGTVGGLAFLGYRQFMTNIPFNDPYHLVYANATTVSAFSLPDYKLHEGQDHICFIHYYFLINISIFLNEWLSEH